jgi:hypothetical protein
MICGLLEAGKSLSSPNGGMPLRGLPGRPFEFCFFERKDEDFLTGRAEAQP